MEGRWSLREWTGHLLLLHVFLLHKGVLADFICDDPTRVNIMDHNEAPENLCCSADSGEGFKFSCSGKGGCCGPKDDNYCCNRDLNHKAIAIGATFGGLALVGIVAVIAFCAIRYLLKRAGKEFYCKGCCRCAVQPIGGEKETHKLGEMSKLEGADTENTPPAGIDS